MQQLTFLRATNPDGAIGPVDYGVFVQVASILKRDGVFDVWYLDEDGPRQEGRYPDYETAKKAILKNLRAEDTHQEWTQVDDNRPE